MPPHSDLEDTYILHVRLAHTKDPTISRVLCVPTDLEFNLFHLVLQAAFGWAETHLYKFTVSKPLPRGQERTRLMPLDNDLLTIHDSDEGWDDEEPMLAAMARLTGHPPPPTIPKALASERTLASVFADPQFANGKAEVVYEYDFGDGWYHEITLLGKAEGDFARKQIGKGVPVEGQMTWCVAGEGHPCAEDAGGPSGWEEVKRAFAGSTEPRAAELREWYTTYCSNGDREGLNPWKWDIFEVNQRLASLHC